MADPDIAIVFTPEPWVEDLHRYFADHGGARVRQLIVDPMLAVTEQYSILVVGWRWPALTAGLVEQLHEQGRRVLGVGDDEEPASAALLRNCGVDAMVSEHADHHEFLAAVTLLHAVSGESALGTARVGAVDDLNTRCPILAVGGPAGTGTTEIALEIARTSDSLLVDCDEVAPALAPRLAIPIEPNLRTAIDAVEFGLGELGASVVRDVDAQVDVVVGIPNVAAWPQMRSTEVLRTLRALAASRAVVVDTSSALDDVAASGRPRYGTTRAVLGAADAVCAVGSATPVGVVRLLSWVADLQMLRPGVPVHIVVNRVSPDRFRRAELVEEITRTFRPLTLTVVPEDRRVAAAAWNGTCVRSGPFTRAVAATNAAIRSVPSVPDSAAEPVQARAS